LKKKSQKVILLFYKITGLYSSRVKVIKDQEDKFMLLTKKLHENNMEQMILKSALLLYRRILMPLVNTY
jgi:hypothetical protein